MGGVCPKWQKTPLINGKIVKTDDYTRQIRNSGSKPLSKLTNLVEKQQFFEVPNDFANAVITLPAPRSPRKMA